jgi:hypothetical protein
MKKIITSMYLTLILINISNMSFAQNQNPAYDDPNPIVNQNPAYDDPNPIVNQNPAYDTTVPTNNSTSTTTTSSTTQEPTNSPVNGITINEDCLLNGQCKYNIYETLGIRKSV